MAIRSPSYLGDFGQKTLDVASDGLDLGNAAQISGDLTFDNSGEPRGLPTTPTASDAAASKAYVDAIAVQNRAWKEVLLADEQLVDGASGGVSQAELFAFTTNPTANDTFIVSDGTTTETFTFKASESVAFDVAIGATAADTLTNLVQAINDDSTLWSAVETAGLDMYFAGEYTEQGVIYRTAPIATATADRLYGSLTVGTEIKVVEFATGSQDYSISAGTESDLPSSDPSAKRFGFGRVYADIATNETHSISNDQTIHTWDSDDEVWQQVDSSIITAGAGLSRTGDTLAVDLDTDADATSGGSGGGTSGLEFDTTGNGAQLRVAVNSAGAIERDTGGGLSVRVDGSTITIVGNQLVASGAEDAQAIKNTYTSGTGGVAAGDPVYFSANDTVAEADASAAVGTGILTIGVAMSAVSVGNPVEVCSSGDQVTGVLTALGASAGDEVWLASGGGLTLTAPTGNIDRVLVGYAINADDLFVLIQQLGRGA